MDNADIPDDTDSLIPAYEAARLLRVSPRTLKRWAARGTIEQFSRPGRSCKYYSADDVQRLRIRRETPGGGRSVRRGGALGGGQG